MQQAFLERAIELAAIGMAQAGGGPFGAVVVQSERIVAEGFNQVTGLHDPTAHAEVSAIRAACRALGAFSLTGCEIYSSCEPCPMCLSAIYWARVERLYFAASRHDAAEAGFDDEWLYRELPLPLAQRRLPTRQLLREAALDAFAQWKAKPDRVPY